MHITPNFSKQQINHSKEVVSQAYTDIAAFLHQASVKAQKQ